MKITIQAHQDIDEDLWALELSARVYNCFIAEAIFSMQTLLSHSEQDLIRIPNFGLKSKREVVEALEKKGLKLRDNNSSSSWWKFVQIRDHLDHSEQLFAQAREELLKAMEEFSRVDHTLNEWRKRNPGQHKEEFKPEGEQA
jgi:hypothetical protein